LEAKSETPKIISFYTNVNLSWPIVKQSQSHVDEGDCVLKDKTNEKLILRSDQVTQQVVGIFRMEDSTVILKGSPSAVHVRGLRNCKLLTGPVSGSIFVDHCQSCTFVLACQQLRIHTTTDSSFYIHVTSKAIIEGTADQSHMLGISQDRK
jgi:hypothetical protein